MNPESAPLLLPIAGNGFSEIFEHQSRRLAAIENRLDNVGRKECEPNDAMYE